MKKITLTEALEKTRRKIEEKYPELLSVFDKYKNKRIFCMYSYNFFDAYWRLRAHLKGWNLKNVAKKYPGGLPKMPFCWKCSKMRKGRCPIWHGHEKDRIEKITEILKNVYLRMYQRENMRLASKRYRDRKGRK